MKNNLSKQTAHAILRQNKLFALTDCRDLQRIVAFYGFTVIAYKKYNNSENISALIQKLGIEKEIEQNNSFLYITSTLKLLFINEDVSDEDKCALLRHELGHILDPFFISSDTLYSKIKKEEFANEFSFYCKKPGKVFMLEIFMIKKWKWLIGLPALMACITGLFIMLSSPAERPASIQTIDTTPHENSDAIYYITSGGKKYHQSFCIIVRYRNNVTECTMYEAASAGYKPCSLCIGAEQ